MCAARDPCRGCAARLDCGRVEGGLVRRPCHPSGLLLWRSSPADAGRSWRRPSQLLAAQAALCGDVHQPSENSASLLLGAHARPRAYVGTQKQGPSQQTQLCRSLFAASRRPAVGDRRPVQAGSGASSLPVRLRLDNDDCIVFSCIFALFSNLHVFSSFSNTHANFSACPLPNTYIHPVGLYDRSYQQAYNHHPTHQPTRPPYPTKARHSHLVLPHPLGPTLPSAKKIVGSGRTGLLMCGARAV